MDGILNRLLLKDYLLLVLLLLILYIRRISLGEYDGLRLGLLLHNLLLRLEIHLLELFHRTY